MTPPACHFVPAPAATLCPLLASCFASCSSLLMRQPQTLGDSLARRTGARTRCVAARYLRALSRCSFGPLGRISPPPVLCSLAGMGKHPPAHNPPGRTPPAPEGTGSRVREPCLRQQGAGPGGEDKATVTERLSGRSLALSGGSCSGDRGPAGHRGSPAGAGGSWPHGAVTGRPRRPVALCARAGQA